MQYMKKMEVIKYWRFIVDAFQSIDDGVQKNMHKFTTLEEYREMYDNSTTEKEKQCILNKYKSMTGISGSMSPTRDVLSDEIFNIHRYVFPYMYKWSGVSEDLLDLKKQKLILDYKKTPLHIDLSQAKTKLYAAS